MLKAIKSKIKNNSLMISFLVCLLSIALTTRQTLTEYELKVSTYETGLIQNSLGAIVGDLRITEGLLAPSGSPYI